MKGPSRLRDIWLRFSGAGVYPHELSALLLIPLRRLILSPRQLIAQLALAPGARVLEIGPGPGFFSIDIARAVPAGRLELVDLQAAMLVKARRRLRAAGIRNVGFTHADGTTLPFKPASFDAVCLVAILGEVANPAMCLASIAKAMRKGGRLVCAELPGDPDALSERQLQSLAADTPLRFERSVRSGRATLTSIIRK